MKNILLKFVFIFYLSSFNLFSQDESFEGSSVPSNWSASIGSLSISTNHYKHNSRSLKWDWKAGDILTVSNLQSQGLVPSQLFGFNFNFFRMWVYNTATIKDNNLEIEFIDDTNTKQYHYPFYLDFKGWRAASISYRYEMFGDKSSRELNTLKIKAPETGSGTFYFDFIDFTAERVDYRSPDKQLPFLNANNNRNWTDMMYLESLPRNIPLNTPTPEELAGFDKIKAKYDNLILGNAPSNSNVNSAIQDYQELKLSFNTDGTIKGEPLYGISLRQLKNIGFVEGFLLTLARDYKHKNNTTSLTYAINTVKHLLDQGFAYGSLLEDSRLIGYSFREITMAIHLLKEELENEGIWEDARKMVDWFTASEIVWHPTAFGSSMDDANTRALDILGACLYKPTNELKVQYLKAYKQFLENWFTISESVTGMGVKPGYIGVHHGTYFPQYTFGAYKTLANTVRLISGTTFAISIEKRDFFKKMLLTSRLHTSKRAIPNSISGRSPFNDPEIESALRNLGLSEPFDTQVLRAYNRVDNPTSETAPFGQEDYPTGFWQTNFANLSTYRQDDWFASIKGFSRYFWGTEIYSSDNRFGRYQSYGAIEIFYPGVKKDSGFDINGWNWNMPPGTTTIHLPWDDLEASKSRQDEATDSFFASGLRFGTKDTYYIDKEVEGTIGIFGMDFQQKGLTNTHNPTFTFKKSVFCFDGMLVSLGSNINNNDTKNRTATNLFQNYLETTSQSINVNNTSVSAFPYTNQVTGETQNWLIDAYNNGYLIRGNKQIVINRAAQTSPRENGNGNFTNGNFASAYIDHSTSPNNEDYEYIIVPKTNAAKMQELQSAMDSNNPLYTILQKDENAHIVSFKEFEGYALFGSNSYNNTLIKSNQGACLVIAEQANNNINVSVVSPDLNLNDNDGKTNPVTITLTFNGKWQVNSSNSNINSTIIDNETEVTIVTKNANAEDFTLETTSLSVANYLTNSIKLYPNPAHQFLNIDITNSQLSISEIQLYDITGRQIETYPFSKKINLNKYTKGVYFITFITSDKNRLTKKIIIE